MKQPASLMKYSQNLQITESLKSPESFSSGEKREKENFSFFEAFSESCDSILNLVDEAEALSAIESDEEEELNEMNPEEMSIMDNPIILRSPKKILNYISYEHLQRSKIVFFIAMGMSIFILTFGILQH